MRNNLWQKFLYVGEFLFGASLGVGIVLTFAWSFLTSVSQHYYHLESSSYGASGFDIVEIISFLSALMIGLASGLSGLYLFGKLRESKLRWLSLPFSLYGYCLLAIIISAIRIWSSVASNSGP